jgi:NADH:ubiquinone oxidoreductase subunit 6 (subunit J)
MSLLSTILLALFGLVAIGGGVAVVWGRDPTQSIAALFVTIAAVGLMLITLGAYFIGLLQLFILSGLLFVLIIRKVVWLPWGERRRDSIPSTSTLGWILLVVLLLMLLNSVFATEMGSGMYVGSMSSAPDENNIDRWYALELLAILVIAALAAMRVNRGNAGGSDEWGGIA